MRYSPFLLSNQLNYQTLIQIHYVITLFSIIHRQAESLVPKSLARWEEESQRLQFFTKDFISLVIIILLFYQSMKIILLLIFIVLRSTSLHLYAGVEQTYIVSQSQSLKNIYACKEKCMALNKIFLYPMKYVRTVWAKSGTNHMYLVGHCFASSGSGSQLSWTPWAALNEAKLVSTTEQQAEWLNFNKECEDKQSEMSQEMRKILGLTQIHSEYIFYSDGKFVNTQEGKQRDINSLFKELQLPGI